MQAKQIYASEKGKVSIREIDIPAPSANEVQVLVEASVVSPGTERAFITSMVNTSDVFPQNLGYSCCGVVTHVGENVKNFVPGDRVAGIMFHQSLSNCAQEKLVKVPDSLSMRDASFVRIGVISMQGVRKARIELGESCAIVGMGLIGQVAMQLARANGAYPIIAIDRVPSKLALAKQCGADIVIDASAPDYLQQVMDATGGTGVNVVIESTGFPAPINDALQMAAKFGRVIILASTRGNTDVNFYRDVHKKALTIIGAHISSNPTKESCPGYWTFQDNATAFLQLAASGRVDVAPLISEFRSYTDVDDIYAHVLNWELDYITTVINWKEA